MKEEQIRPKHLFDEYLRLSAADVASFFPSSDTFVARDCPACGDGAKQWALTKQGFDYVRCGGCGTLYAPRIPRPEDLAAFYRDSPSTQYWAEVFFPSVAEARRDLIFAPRAERVFELTGGADRAAVWADIGSGIGLMLEEARKRRPGLTCRVVEPSASMAATCRGKGFDVFEGFSHEAAKQAGWAGQADIVTSFEVLEHLDEVQSFLEGARELLAPGGHIVMSGLCGDGFDICVLGAGSKAISPPHHLTFLSRAGVAAALERAGLELVAFLTPGKLDVDIVRNTLTEMPAVTIDPYFRRIVFAEDEAIRVNFQSFLAESGLSSHMWFVARHRT